MDMDRNMIHEGLWVDVQSAEHCDEYFIRVSISLNPLYVEELMQEGKVFNRNDMQF